MGASDDVDPRDPEGHLVHEVCVTSIVNCDCTTLGYEDLVYQVLSDRGASLETHLVLT